MPVWWLFAAYAQEDSAPESSEEPHVELVYRGTLPLPAELEGDVTWKRGRFGEPLLVDASGRSFALDQGNRVLAPYTVDAPTSYRFPKKYFERWDVPWLVVRGEERVPLDEAEPFDTPFLASRWGTETVDALVDVRGDHIDVFTITPPSTFNPLPACRASVPESCLASALQILRENTGDARARKVARGQIRRACDDGVVRACFIGVTLDEGDLAEQARDCLDDDAEACASVAGTVYAQTKLEGRPSRAGERMLEYACERGVAGACSEAARMFDDRALPHNALLMLDRACVSGDRDACSEVQTRRDAQFAATISKACLKDEPDPVGCITLAQFLEETPIDDLEIDAFGAWQRACAGGEDAACRAMGPYVDTWGMDDLRVRDASETLLGKCEGGQPEACVGAAHLLVRLDVRDDRYAKARTLYADACQNGSNTGCIAGASQNWSGTAKRLDTLDAAPMYRIACERDSAAGCAGLGKILAESKRTQADAVGHLQRGCDLGSATACTDLGRLAQRGVHEMEVDPRTVFEKGCEEGDGEACYELGRTLAGKRITDPSDPAFAAYERACASGQLAACEQAGLSRLTLGTHYEAGLAAQQFERACDAGLTTSCRELSGLYRTGKGVPRDRKRSRALLVKAGELEPVKHVRIGARLGFLNLLGLDGELVIPLPAGPAVSVGGEFSYLPGQGLSMMYLGPTARLYPSHAARGLYGAVGWHQFRIQTGENTTTTAGFNGRVGARVTKGNGWGGVEIGLGSVDAPELRELIEPIPLVVPVFGVSGGVAFL